MSTAGMLPLVCEIILTLWTEPLEVHSHLLCLSNTFELDLFGDSSRFGIFNRLDLYLCS